MPITPEKLKEITAEPLLAVLATVNPDGTPQATPLWYHYDGEYFKTTCFQSRIKVRNIRQNPYVSLVIVDTSNNGMGLIVRGTAELIEDGVPEATLVNATRYVGDKLGREAAGDLTSLEACMGPRYIIRIKPYRIIYDEH